MDEEKNEEYKSKFSEAWTHLVEGENLPALLDFLEAKKLDNNKHSWKYGPYTERYYPYDFYIALTRAIMEDYEGAEENLKSIFFKKGEFFNNVYREFLIFDFPYLTKQYFERGREIKRLKSQIKKLETQVQGDDPVETSEEEKEEGSFVRQRLSSIIGLESVKSEIESLYNLGQIRKKKQEKGLKISPSTMHLVFKGNPGTGKTTIARILGEIYKEIGLLEKGHLVEVNRSQLVANYVGQTATKVEEVVNSALGGVLFIDEAYALSEGGDNDFGKEAINTLVPLMENHRDDLVVIVAGYPEKMQAFLEMNDGLRSRFSRTIDFEDYSSGELYSIFKILCYAGDFRIHKDAIESIKKYLKERSQENLLDFGNGRGVRNLLEIIEKNHANRIAKIKEPTEFELQTILLEDLPHEA